VNGIGGLPSFRIEPLDTSRHDRANFECGVEELDRYLKTQAAQDMRRKASAVFVMTPLDAPSQIAGYFTLSAMALEQTDVPKAARRHIPRYPLVSATLIGRLAVAKERQGQGLGSILLASALRKAYDNADVVGSSMIVVEAIDERAVRFYEAHGFVRLPESMRLIIPMRAIGSTITPEASTAEL
jgi:GNAT superfamily N-acetyltransferase